MNPEFITQSLKTIQVVLITILAVSVFVKVKFPERALRSIEALTKHRNSAIALLSAACILESLAIALLIFDPVYGGALSIGLFVVFTIFILISLRFDTKQACNCFGQSETVMSVNDVYRNLILLGITSAIFWLNAQIAVPQMWSIKDAIIFPVALILATALMNYRLVRLQMLSVIDYVKGGSYDRN